MTEDSISSWQDLKENTSMGQFKLGKNYPCKTNKLSDMVINVPEIDKSSRYKLDKFSV